MGVPELISLINDWGILGLFVIIILTGMRQIWVWGWTYQMMIRERDEWKRIALQNYRVVEKTAEIIAQK